MAISPDRTELIQKERTPLVISPTVAGQWLNMSQTVIGRQQDVLVTIIESVQDAVEKYMWLDLTPATYISYYMLQDYACLQLAIERAPIIELSDIQKIEYLRDDQWVEYDRGLITASGLYENTTEIIDNREWAVIDFVGEVPYQVRDNAYNMRITFNAGYKVVDGKSTIPRALNLALLKTIAFHYTNRGDCADKTTCSAGTFPVPCDAKSIFDQYALNNTVLGGYYSNARMSYGTLY